MIVYTYILVGLQAVSLIVQLGMGKSQAGLTTLFSLAFWAPIYGRVVGLW